MLIQDDYRCGQVDGLGQALVSVKNSPFHYAIITNNKFFNADSFKEWLPKYSPMSMPIFMTISASYAFVELERPEAYRKFVIAHSNINSIYRYIEEAKAVLSREEFEEKCAGLVHSLENLREFIEHA